MKLIAMPRGCGKTTMLINCIIKDPLAGLISMNGHAKRDALRMLREMAHRNEITTEQAKDASDRIFTNIDHMVGSRVRRVYIDDLLYWAQGMIGRELVMATESTDTIEMYASPESHEAN